MWPGLASDARNCSCPGYCCPQFRKFIERGAFTVDTATVTGITPLHLACEQGSLELAKYLLDHGANVNAHDNVRP